MGFPMQPQPGVPPMPQPQQPPAQQPPVFNVPGLQQQPQQPSNVEAMLAQVLESNADMRNQVAQLTTAVNGLGGNQEALHQWLVAQVEQITGMISGIVNAVRQEGIAKLLTGVFTGGVPQQPPGQPGQQ